MNFRSNSTSIARLLGDDCPRPYNKVVLIPPMCDWTLRNVHGIKDSMKKRVDVRVNVIELLVCLEFFTCIYFFLLKLPPAFFFAGLLMKVTNYQLKKKMVWKKRFDVGTNLVESLVYLEFIIYSILFCNGDLFWFQLTSSILVLLLY